MTLLLPVAAHYTDAVFGLLMGAFLVPIAATCIGLYVAGRTLTPGGQRSLLGIWLGRWMFWGGNFFLAMAVLTFSRWLDLDPETTYLHVSRVARMWAVAALILMAISTWFVGPLVLDRIRRGRI